MSKLQQHIEELFDKQFPLIRETGIEEVEGVFFSKDDSEKVKSFIATILEEATKETVGDTIGKIGAKLLAKHSSQAILDAYFDLANEVMEEHETHN